ncbi:ABC transporter ATP-binding protein [Nonomuraea soli]|uniref:Peptide/nickel transport system ATP-binding protein n=1 Tax=Nonomuraea soli TaxID=1032476 RepID=A0A7W0HS03_9ACTN|nr:ABC transporter ATP-binding protein [Nonomuraea soli]MBA2893558.1 peptide/nickel transport system ATP-binding protein [Nonomuraea soli]
MLKAENVTLAYGRTPVVHDVTLEITPGGVGLIGESGSGKTTLARAFLGLLKPVKGVILYGGRPLTDLRAFRREVQPVFQAESLDPRMRVGRSIAEARPAMPVASLMEAVGLDPALAGRRPHELSGGQRQRVVIARALAVEPRLLILDEPTSALDVTVQARILELLAGLETERLLITHNLAVVSRLCRTSHVLFAGRVVESGPTAELLARPMHPYTRALREAVPELGGSPPAATGAEPVTAATGCAYRLRCPLAVPACEERPEPVAIGDRRVACHRATEL